MGDDQRVRSGRAAWQRRARVTWAVVSVLTVESVIFGLAMLPASVLWAWHYRWTGLPVVLRYVVLAIAFVPTYMLFAIGLMVYSAAVTRLFGWRTHPALETHIADCEWPLLDWARYLVSIHVVRLFAGATFRSSPVWAMYMRLNGARVGRSVWVNSLSIMDHNLLDLGDRCVIGSDAHIAGHIVERGVLKTAPVHIGRGVTIGIGTVIGIGVRIGDHAQVGALSVVPKHSRLEAGRVYGGVPVRDISPSA
ncbi:MAG TPA: hypothetical protein VFT29_05225 [Gemmatimonadaceae bacterium]|nr:hypothetical protein [Gemmatimonadaceae bacterium]